MMFKQFLVSVAMGRAVRAAVIVFIGMFIGHYFFHQQAFWIPAIALFMVQTVIGLTMHKGLQWLLAIVLGVMLASYLVFCLQNVWLISLLAILFLTIMSYFSIAQFSRTRIPIELLIAVIIIGTLIFPSVSVQMIHARTFAIMLGGVIGLAGSILIFPTPVDVAFRKKMILLLALSSEYFSAILASVFDHTLETKTSNAKHQLEENWKKFPAWIYDAGFIPVLQQGHRHFLVRMEQMRQILYSLHYLARYRYDERLLQPLQEPMQRYLEKVDKLFQAVISVLMLQTLSEGVEDISESFYALEDRFNEILPFSIEGLEVKQEYVSITQLIDELKELGKIVLILAQALR